MSIRIYNTLTKRLEEFVPLEDKHVKMYNCGPTVYDYFHIGNARNFVTAEVMRRYFEYKGYKVTFVQNVTDIEDKIIRKANEMGVKPSDVANKFTEEYFRDIKSLGIKEPTYSPKATEHIDEIISFVQKLVEKGFAYEVDGDVYYDVSKFEGYGKLSGQKLDEIVAGARVEVDERKRNPADFSLWKKSKPGEPGWESPWGIGRPGWHIECSVMSSKYLGETFDIHSGGNDLIFPHHENEIAQSEALTGKPLARYWVHNGMLQITGSKMSKSLGNILSVRELLKKYDANSIRLYLISAHYRAPLEYREGSLNDSASAVRRIENCLSMIKMLTSLNSTVQANDGRVKELEEKIEDTYRRFEEAMDDDFNTPAAIASIFELVSEVNKFASEASASTEQGRIALKKAESAIKQLSSVLGLNFEEDETIRDRALIEELIKLIIDIRQEARSKKDWQTSDKIRERLANIGIILHDTREGTVWEFKR